MTEKKEWGIDREEEGFVMAIDIFAQNFAQRLALERLDGLDSSILRTLFLNLLSEISPLTVERLVELVDNTLGEWDK